jgi:putative peptidoglycan lipid II flippase
VLRSSAVVARPRSRHRLRPHRAIAYALGVTALAGTYSYANETPNIVYELLLGGVSRELVPLFVKYFDSDDGRRAAIFTVAMLALLAVTVVGDPRHGSCSSTPSARGR